MGACRGLSTVVVKWRQAGQNSGLTTIELAKLGHLRKQERSRARTDAADCSELCAFSRAFWSCAMSSPMRRSSVSICF